MSVCDVLSSYVPENTCVLRIRQYKFGFDVVCFYKKDMFICFTVYKFLPDLCVILLVKRINLTMLCVTTT